MTEETAVKIVRVLATSDTVFGFETDVLIRKYGNSMSAAALFPVLAALRLDGTQTLQKLEEGFRDLEAFGPNVLIGLDDGRWLDVPEDDDSEEKEEDEECCPVVRCFRVNYENAQASYYLFHHATDAFSPSFVTGGSYKRFDASHYIRLELKRAEHFQIVLEETLACPHVIGIEDITEDEFHEIAMPPNASCVK